MILSNLEIIGFKSFPKRVKLEFGPGITGIVGPNGCGKSNLVDAIRWVMGEQKGSILRSEKMEQVIFAGTSERKPLGMAEVSLTVDNNDGILPPEYNTINVTRRLYRDGESDYLINNQKRRLKDIVDMFLDTGLGADSYSIMEPELIQRILTEEPEEKRALFEEAAGIAKYKIRVRTAKRRLEDVNNNLERLTDILSEVEKNVRNLKKQYNQAKVYESLKHRQDEIETTILALERAGFWDELIKISKTCDEWRRKLKDKESVKVAVESELRINTESMSLTEVQIKDTRSTYERFQAEAMEAKNRLLLLEEKENSALSEKERTLENVERDRQRCDHFDERITSQQALCDRLYNEVSSMQLETSATHTQFASAEKNAKSAQLAVAESEKRANHLKSEANILEKDISHLKFKVTAYSERLKELDGESHRLSQEILQLTIMKNKEAEDKVRWEGSWQESLNKLEEVEKTLSDLSNRIEENERVKSQLLIKIERLKSEAQYLHSLLASGGGLPAGAKKLLEIKPPGLIDSLVNILQVRPENALAIETALKENAFLLVSDSVSSACSLIDLLRKNPLGRATVVHLSNRFQAKKRSAPSLPGVIAEACDLVECEPRYRELLDYLLFNILVVDKWEDAEAVYDSGQWEGAIVTLNGESLSKFSMSAGKIGNCYPAIGQRQQVAKIESDILALQDELLSLEGVISDLKSEKAQLEQRELSIISERDEFNDRQNQCIKALAISEGKYLALQNRETAIAKEMVELQTNTAQTENAIIDFLQKALDLASQIAQLDKDLSEKRKVMDSANKDLAKKRDFAHQAELKLASRNGEYERIKSELALALARRNELTEEMSRLHSNIAILEERIYSCKAGKIEVEKTIANRTQSLAEWKIKLETMEDDYRRLRENRSEIERNLHDISSQIDECKEKISANEILIAELKSKISGKEDSAMERFGIDLSAWEIPEESDKKKLETESERLKRKITALGPVNLLALEEYSKEKARFDFLQGEHKDIVQSKEELLETISKTNIEARARFKKVFAEVASYFQLLFADLFDGGEGELSLAEGDPLEAKIELRANPAGKKLLSLDQLSGGEKTLTALALLFALYQVKPGPFCILDEVDAPLDDANVDRFLRLLRRFSPNTQFILITHNKITMEACDYLYGVTMEEEGVSKIASLKLASSHKNN
jgi:chromosome segregation protein